MCQFVCMSVLYFPLSRHPFVFPRTFDIAHNSLCDIVALLSYSTQRKNQLKWIYAPQYYLHYRFNSDKIIYLVCCLKRQNNFPKCRIPTGRTIWSSRDVPNYTFYFWYPGSLLPPNSSAVGSEHTCLCGFRHSLLTVSGRHGADGSALDMFCSFMYGWLS